MKKKREFQLIRIGVLAAALLPGCSKAQDSGALDRLRQDDALVSIKARCHDEGERATARWRGALDGASFPSDPAYGYNSDLRTCLYADGYIGKSITPGVTHIEEWVVLDVLSNRVVLEYIAQDGKPVAIEGRRLASSESEFEKQKAALLGWSSERTGPAVAPN